MIIGNPMASESGSGLFVGRESEASPQLLGRDSLAGSASNATPIEVILDGVVEQSDRAANHPSSLWPGTESASLASNSRDRPALSSGRSRVTARYQQDQKIALGRRRVPGGRPSPSGPLPSRNESSRDFLHLPRGRGRPNRSRNHQARDWTQISTAARGNGSQQTTATGTCRRRPEAWLRPLSEAPARGVLPRSPHTKPRWPPAL